MQFLYSLDKLLAVTVNRITFVPSAARKCEGEVLSDPVKKLRCLLPSSCDVVGVVAPGIVGKSPVIALLTGHLKVFGLWHTY